MEIFARLRTHTQPTTTLTTYIPLLCFAYKQTAHDITHFYATTTCKLTVFCTECQDTVREKKKKIQYTQNIQQTQKKTQRVQGSRRIDLIYILF